MSSLGEISVTIRAVNEATPAFEAIGRDAAAMGSAVGASAAGFETLKTQAESTAVSLRTVASGIQSVASMGSGLITLATDFGLVDRETGKYLRTITTMTTVVAACARMYNFLNFLTTGHSAAVALDTSLQTANAGSSLAVAAAHKIKAAATWVASSAQATLNMHHAAFLALTGVGIPLIIAAAAAMAYFAAQMNVATESIKSYNAAAAETPGKTKAVIRAGEEMLLRRGVEP